MNQKWCVYMCVPQSIVTSQEKWQTGPWHTFNTFNASLVCKIDISSLATCFRVKHSEHIKGILQMGQRKHHNLYHITTFSSLNTFHFVVFFAIALRRATTQPIRWMQVFGAFSFDSKATPKEKRITWNVYRQDDGRLLGTKQRLMLFKAINTGAYHLLHHFKNAILHKSHAIERRSEECSHTRLNAIHHCSLIQLHTLMRENILCNG